jgi:hypothetical protein
MCSWQVFGRCVDPENFAAEVYPCLNAWQAQACDERLGVLRLFSPLNPTGAYDLLLSHPAHYLVAVRLVELFQQQVSRVCPPGARSAQQSWHLGRGFWAGLTKHRHNLTHGNQDVTQPVSSV